MLHTRIAMILMTIYLSVLGVTGTQAGELHGHKKHFHDRHQRQSFYGGDGLPSYVRGIGTYSGAIAAVRDRGNGIYFAADRWSGSNQAGISSAVRPRLIHVNKRTMGAECSYEAGVCVIRP